MLIYLPSILALGLAAIVALLLGRIRHSPIESVAERIAASRSLALATGIQSVHFIEEAMTGFHRELGKLLGSSEIPLPIFLAFNLILIVIWIVSIRRLRADSTPAFVAAWFLAIAGVINLVAHPLLTIYKGGYFPGLVTSPLIGFAAAWLGIQLIKATQAR